MKDIDLSNIHAVCADCARTLGAVGEGRRNQMKARRPMVSETERPRNCDNCRHATDYWPMYCGNDHRKWGTVRCSKDSPRKAKRYKLTYTCKLWEEQEDA